MGCPTSIVPGYSDTNKIKNKPLEMKLEREMAKTTDEDTIRLYRASSPTVKFSDVWDADAFNGTGFNPKGLKGEYYTPDYNYADYFRETYGKDAKITHIDVPKKGLDKYKVNDTEYVIPEGLARKS